jgi:hypothetical protein
MATDDVINAGTLKRKATQCSTSFSQTRFRLLSKRIRILTLTLTGLIVLTGGALAHPPAEAVVTYDETTGDLIVAVTHPVDDPTTHYVKQVTVMQRDIKLIDKSYTSQPDRSSFTYRYNLPQLKGSIGEVRADVQCNWFGSRSGTLMVTQNLTLGTPGSSYPAAPPPTKSPVSEFAALVAVGFVARHMLV